jgi:FlaA1/EpsC-like NDP-sugar epimerase
MHHVVTESRGGNARRVLIIGIGDAGDLVLRTLQRSQRRVKAVGFLDDRGGYVNRTVHGVRVLGRLEDLAAVARRYEIDEVIVALGSERIAQTVILACKDLELPARDLMSFIKAELQADPEPTAVAV